VSRALIVEDDPSIRRAIVRLLDSFGVEVEHAASVKQAMGMLVPPIDLVLADVRLPDGSGHSVITAALRLQPVPVLIAVSGVASAREAFDLARAGAVAFLVKPFGLEELERCLREACDARALRASTSRTLSPAAEQALSDLVRRYGLTTRQAQVVRLTAEGTRRADLPTALGISDGSCKTLVRRVLQRSGTARLSDLAFAVLASQEDSSGMVNSAAAQATRSEAALPLDEAASRPLRRAHPGDET
jgi:DNA-binding NtrC family response regulator